MPLSHMNKEVWLQTYSVTKDLFINYFNMYDIYTTASVRIIQTK